MTISPTVSKRPHATASLSDWLTYLQQIHVSAIDMGLSRVAPVAERLGVVQAAKQGAYVFSVAGTNGKGSTTAVIAALCQAAGYKTALYQSPHLNVFNERVRIDGEMVSDQTLIAAFARVDAARVDCQLTLSFFEITTLAALLIFAEADCAVWVLEVGLGGRLDVVNLIDPDVAVITNIGIDHVAWLGNTLEDIGREKAGILRPNIPIIYGDHTMPVSVRTEIDAQHALCYQVQQDFSYRALDADHWQYSNAAVTLELPRPALSLTNVATGLSAVLASALTLEIPAIIQAMQTVRLAGRFDYRQCHDRQWLFDVAHNEHGVAFLLTQLTSLWRELSKGQSHSQPSEPPPSIKVVFSMLEDKDIKGVVERLVQSSLPLSAWFIAEIDYPRAASLTQLDEAMSALINDEGRHHFRTLAQATQAAIEASSASDLILVCGSFHTIAEVLATLESSS